MSEKMIFCLGDGRCEAKGEGYQKNHRVFNQDISEKEYEKIRDSLDIKLKLTEWNEKTKSLDVYSYTDAWKNWWDSASKKDKESVTKMKYFDQKMFTEITGIEDIEVNDEVEIVIDGKSKFISRKSAKALNLIYSK